MHMKQICQVVSCIVLICITGQVMAVSNQGRKVTEKTVVVSEKNPQFKINLASNPTTGYSWYLEKYDDTLLKLSKYRYQQSEAKKGMVGQGGQVIFEFAAKAPFLYAPQKTSLTFIYARSWEMKEGTVRTFDIVSQV